MKSRLLLWASFLCAVSSAASAQSTWLGGTSGSFNTPANWSSATFPTSGADLTFGAATNFNISVNTSFVANSLTFSGAYPHYSFSGPNSLTVGAGGITVSDTTGGGFGTVDFGGSLNLVTSAGQTWATNGNMTVSGVISGANTITKTGSGYLALSSSSNAASGIVVSAGTLYLGQGASAGSGAISLADGTTLGAQFGDLILGNALSLSSGATLGGTLNGSSGSIELSRTVTLASATSTINLNAGDVTFSGTLTGPASTALTFHGSGSGAVLLTGSVANVASLTADNAAVLFNGTATMPTSTIQATNGGYVSIADNTFSTVSAFLGKITDKANFNGVLGFDSGENSSPVTFSNTIDLSGYTAGQVRIGTATSAVLTGTIMPLAQSYDFGGFSSQGGFLAVKSILAGASTGVSVVSPSASGGAAQHGEIVALQGANTFGGNISVSFAAVVLDSASALPSGSFTLGTNSYLGYTESTAYTSFANFTSHLSGYTSTSVLGFDSHSTLDAFITGSGSSSARTISETLNLSAFNPIFLGTFSGATINSTDIIAPLIDSTLRLVNLQDVDSLTINTVLTDSNEHALVAGMPGAKGTIVLNGVNTFAGGTTLQGGSLLLGNGNALGTGPVSVLSTVGGSNMILGAASGSVSISNPLAVTDFLNLGTKGPDSSGSFTPGTASLTLGGVISDIDGSHHARLYVTSPATFSSANTYSGGTYILANTTVSSNTGLGTNFVDLGYNATLTFTSSNPSIGVLANAGNFITGAGTGTVKLGASASLSINQTSTASFSGQIIGTDPANPANVTKTGAGQLTLLGTNAAQSIGLTTINAGNLAIGDANATTASFGGNVSVAAGSQLIFRPGNTQDMSYTGTISGLGNVTINGNSGGTTTVSAGSTASTLSGATNVFAGTLHLAGNNLWSTSSAINLSGGTTLKVDGNQTVTSLSGSGSVNLPTAGTTLTVSGTTGTTLSGIISGSGALSKAGSSVLILTSNNSYTGNTTITGGTLQLGSGGSTGSVVGSIDIGTGSSLVINRSGFTTISNVISGLGGVTNTAGSTTLSGANTYSGGTFINGSTVVVSSNSNLGGATGGIIFNSGAGTATLQTNGSLGSTVSPATRSLFFNSAGTFNTNGSDTTISGTVNGTGAFTKSGAGKLTLTNTGSTFTGTTTVFGGTLAVSGNLSGSSLTTVSPGAKLFGSGSIGAVSVSGGGTLAGATPVGAPATFSGGSYSLSSGSTLDFFLTNATAGSQGTGWSLLTTSGTLNLNNVPITLALITVNSSGTSAAALNFNPLVSSHYLVASATGGILGFSSSNIGINTSGFVNSASGSFTTSLTGNNLFLDYTPSAIPEPATTGVIAGLAVLGAMAWRRRSGPAR